MRDVLALLERQQSAAPVRSVNLDFNQFTGRKNINFTPVMFGPCPAQIQLSVNIIIGFHRVMMKECKTLHTRLNRHINNRGRSRMTPTSFGWVLFIEILSMGNQKVGADHKVQIPLRNGPESRQIGFHIKGNGAGVKMGVNFTVSCVNDLFSFLLQAIGKAATGMNLLEIAYRYTVDGLFTLLKLLGFDVATEVFKVDRKIA